ncbi:hypothetical protein L227DRAFT_578911 [Lentinus tigrinus ALCF2SS1-6]|uniref:Thioesterase domain-containing protein n=1 Tax=Lentinus tigrinus ALCF2SS1-6 TaxID=1328759 RepID=A0A5C2RZF8_9APHY|nr:hypothetical protein L227DRAFT_578911 [Lentinus tigrinus ALCF2SS1-6]
MKPSPSRSPLLKLSGLPPESEARIRASLEKITLGKPGSAFASAVGGRLVPTEVEVFTREKDGKQQARMVYEIDVSEDMLNIGRTMHGGCAVYLIDVCSSVALMVLAGALDKPTNFVSQALNTTFHAPAPAGAKLEIVNTTIAFGGRTVSAITEIWDVTNKRLCMTGVHNKMAPSKPIAKL